MEDELLNENLNIRMFHCMKIVFIITNFFQIFLNSLEYVQRMGIAGSRSKDHKTNATYVELSEFSRQLPLETGTMI